MKSSLLFLPALVFLVAACGETTQPTAPPAETKQVVQQAAPLPPKPAAIPIYDGPFGLQEGLSKQDLESMGIALSSLGVGRFKTDNLPKARDDFEYYILVVTEKEGLCKIIASGQTIEAGNFGGDLLAKFDYMESQLQEIYGRHKRVDGLKSGSIWNRPKDWMMGLRENDRFLLAIWDASKGSAMKNRIDTIGLQAVALNSTTGFIRLSYEFGNFEICKKDWQEKEKAAL